MKKQAYSFFIFADTAWNWSADYVRQTCYEAAKKGNVVCFIWNNTLSLKEYFLCKDRSPIIFRPKRNVLVYEPLFWIPFKRLRIVQQLNLYLNLVIFYLIAKWGLLQSSQPKRVTWVFHPFFQNILPRWRAYSHTDVVVFDLVDNFVGALRGSERRETKRLQEQLAVHATVVAANSQYLYDQLKKITPNVTRVPQGFQLSAFSQRSTTPFGKSPSRPVIGYAGGLNDRLDYSLIKQLVSRHPEWEFWFWGDVQLPDHPSEKESASWVHALQELQSRNNVRFSSGSRAQLAHIYPQFDVGIIPYDVRKEFNRFCFPMKVFEYFYFGVPVISTPIHELSLPVYTSYVHIGTTLADWEHAIAYSLAHPLEKNARKGQKKFCLSQTWEKKVGAILSSFTSSSRISPSE